MKDTSGVTYVTSRFRPQGAQREKFLASGVHVALRLRENEKPNEKKPISEHPCETGGYVLKDKAEGQTLILNGAISFGAEKR